MNHDASGLSLQPFFLPAEIGQRFCIYHTPNPGTACRGAIIYIHPFGDEMNMARRMAALQSKKLTSSGFAVLQIDLFGCGDSSGEFCDARWEIWKQDLALARQWLAARHTAPISLWGLRLGALLALDFAKQADEEINSLVLWQPVTNGELFLTQFLRMRLANQMMSESGEKNSSTGALRAELAAGEVLEVAGYEIAPAMAAAIDKLDIAVLSPTNRKVHWFDITPDATRPMTPAGARVVGVWQQEGIDLTLNRVSCQPFWSAPEVIECGDLLSMTVAALSEDSP